MEDKTRISSFYHNYDSIIEELTKNAFQNEVQNLLRNSKETDSKSIFESGNATVACLLLFLCFESIIRIVDMDKTNSHNKKIEEVFFNMIKDDFKSDEIFIKETLSELTLIRDSIVHGYIYSYELESTKTSFNIYEKACYGKRIDEINDSNSHNITISPRKIGFADIAIMYKSICILLLSVGIRNVINNCWTSSKFGIENEVLNKDLFCDEWFNIAMESINCIDEKWKILSDIYEKFETIDFQNRVSLSQY